MTNPNTNPDYCKDAEKTALVRLCGVLGVLTENNDLATAALLAATRIERLEKKIPALNVDLAEASMHAYNGEIARMKLEAEIESLKSERRWIPVSERLPRSTDNYLVACVNSSGRKVIHESMWFDAEDGNCWSDIVRILTVTHWMPLPKPPEDK